MKIKRLITSCLIVLILLIRFISQHEIITNIGGLFLIYFILIGNFILIHKKISKPLYDAMPFTMILIVLLLLLFGYINILPIGAIIISIIGLGSFIYYSNEINFKLFFSKEISFFSILFFVLFVSNYFVNFNVWDEYSYWSVASKNYYLSNSINFSKINILPHGDGIIYPPNPTILQYFFLKILGSYRQGFELLTLQVFGFTILFPLFQFAKNRNQSFLISIICLCLPAIFCLQGFYYTIYADTLTGLLVGYGLINIVENNKDSKLSFLFSLILVSLTRAAGIMFSCVMILFYIIKCFLENWKNNDFCITVRNCLKNKFIYISVLTVLITILGNNLYYKMNPTINNNIQYQSIKNQTVGSVSNALKSLFAALTGYKYNDFAESITTSVDHLLVKKYYSHEPFNLSVYNWIVIFALILYSIYHINKNNRTNTKNISISLIVSILIYIVILQISYLFMFNIGEAVLHNSAHRYIGAMLLGSFVFIIYYFLKETKKSNYLILITLIVMLFTPIDAIIKNTILVGNRNRLTRSYLIEEQKIAKLITDNVKNKDELITLNQGDNNFLLKIIYFAAPFNVTNTIKFDKELFEINNMKDKILSHNYVLIVEKDEFLEKQFKDIFKQEINNMTLYKNDDGKLIEIKN